MYFVYLGMEAYLHSLAKSVDQIHIIYVEFCKLLRFECQQRNKIVDITRFQFLYRSYFILQITWIIGEMLDYINGIMQIISSYLLRPTKTDFP